MTITEFLLARIEEDERAANRADKTWRATMHGVPKGSAGHVDRWSPYQVKIECEAKRRTVNSMETLMGHEKTYLERMRHTEEQDDVYVIAVSTLRALASVYADHPDYDAAWAV